MIRELDVEDSRLSRLKVLSIADTIDFGLVVQFMSRVVWGSLYLFLSDEGSGIRSTT